ncbi:C-C motif chemokine 19b [Clupea harengus]|uniref:C-C motif chemokine 19b n=1 Tax=Clupea harengus TaxID=7950 RepID=A0A6P3W5V6_CLUHA|nr:C-C motif chemokine 19b [Clupea harengus]
MLLQSTVLFLLACGLWNSATASEGAVDCCLTTGSSRIPQRLVKSYAVQTTDRGCRIEATLFITHAGKTLCAPPASRQKWVKNILKKLNKKGRNGKNRRRGKNGKNVRG